MTSEPAQAVCELQREGAVVGAVAATPGTVTVSRSSRDMSIRCVRPGYQPGISSVPAGFQPMTVGNLLVGGIIGIAVDAASGAIGQYPGSVHVTLPLDQGTAGGNNWYDVRRREIGSQADERIAAVRAACTDRPTAGGAPTSCELALSSINSQRESELRLLQEQKARTPQA